MNTSPLNTTAPRWLRIINLILLTLTALNIPPFLLAVVALFATKAEGPLQLFFNPYAALGALLAGILLAVVSVSILRRRWKERSSRYHWGVFATLLVVGAVTSIQPFIFVEM